MDQLPTPCSTPPVSPPPPQARVFAPLGPNPAPLTELLWALARQEGLRVATVDLVVTAEAAFYLQDEVLGPRGALAQLREVLGDAAPAPEAVWLHDARDVEGLPLEDDRSPEDAARYRAAVWAGARAALARAGEDPLVFGFIAGRRRTMTVLQAAVFQLLARPQDRAYDVRVSDPRVEGGTGFFFPEQPQRHIRAPGWTVDARAVAVHLVPVELPRLGHLVSQANLHSYEAALQAGQAAVDAAAPPEVVVDLVEGELWVDGALVPITGAKLVWFAILAAARQTGDGWVTWNEAPEVAQVARAVMTSGWWSSIRAESLRTFLTAKAAGEVGAIEAVEDALRRQRVDFRKALDAAASASGHRQHLSLEESRAPGSQWRARLRLPGERVVIRWSAGAPRR
jgi:CRISPR-associated protein (TIGR02584 family)